MCYRITHTPEPPDKKALYGILCCQCDLAYVRRMHSEYTSCCPQLKCCITEFKVVSVEFTTLNILAYLGAFGHAVSLDQGLAPLQVPKLTSIWAFIVVQVHNDKHTFPRRGFQHRDIEIVYLLCGKSRGIRGSLRQSLSQNLGRKLPANGYLHLLPFQNDVIEQQEENAALSAWDSMRIAAMVQAWISSSIREAPPLLCPVVALLVLLCFYVRLLQLQSSLRYRRVKTIGKNNLKGCWRRL